MLKVKYATFPKISDLFEYRKAIFNSQFGQAETNCLVQQEAQN